MRHPIRTLKAKRAAFKEYKQQARARRVRILKLWRLTVAAPTLEQRLALMTELLALIRERRQVRDERMKARLRALIAVLRPLPRFLVAGLLAYLGWKGYGYMLHEMEEIANMDVGGGVPPTLPPIEEVVPAPGRQEAGAESTSRGWWW
jgi:hypothetical protein